MLDMATLHERIKQRLSERIELAEKSTPCPRGKLDLGPLFSHLDDLIQVVESIHDYSTEPYMDRVRQVVCATCRADGTGGCATRDHGLCGLDKYFDLIVAVVEEELRAE